MNSLNFKLETLSRHVADALIGILLYFFFTSAAPAQIQQAWVARYNNDISNGTNQALKMALDTSGNIYITGFSENTVSNLGYVTIKYAPNGNQTWVARYDSTNYPSATPSGLVLDNGNNVIVTGSALTVKFDPTGNLLWTAAYGGTTMCVDSSANVYVGGFSQDFGVVKLSPQGSKLWLQTYIEQYGPTVSQSVLVDAGGNVYVSGLDTIRVGGGPIYSYYADLTIIKYGPSGNLIWKASQQYDAQNVHVRGAALDSANNLYITASFSPAPTVPPYLEAVPKGRIRNYFEARGVFNLDI